MVFRISRHILDSVYTLANLLFEFIKASKCTFFIKKQMTQISTYFVFAY